jgi:hypothetical protein
MRFTTWEYEMGLKDAHPTFRAAAPVMEPLHRDRFPLQNHAAIAAYLVQDLRRYFLRSGSATQRAAPNRRDSVPPFARLSIEKLLASRVEVSTRTT